MSIYNGVLLIDKPSGGSSHDVVRRVRKILGMSAVGHCGTLDPMASGLMVMLLGEATKLSKYILEQNKSYDLEAEFGYVTDTLDATGEVLSRSEEAFELSEIENHARQLQGALELPVPAYSAVKVQGKKLYELARSGEEVQTPIRRMEFFDLQKQSEQERSMSFSISCSKGSYIRAWVQALGEKSGVGATLTKLRRTASFPFRLEDALTFEELEEKAQDLKTSGAFLPMAVALPHMKTVHVTGKDHKLLVNGQISHRLKSELITRYQPGSEGTMKVLCQESGQMLALVGLEKQKGFVIRRVFNH